MGKPLPSAGNLARLSDAQARNLVLAALRKARVAYRKADTSGEKEERELDRLITRKTRINATSLETLFTRYDAYFKDVQAIAYQLAILQQVALRFT